MMPVRCSCGQLPGMEIEIVHRRSQDADEASSINLQAAPSLEAFDRFLATAIHLHLGLRHSGWRGFPGLSCKRLDAAPECHPNPT